MALWDVAMAPVRAFGGAFNELDKAMQGRDAGQEKKQRQLLSDLQVVQQSTPDNTPARIEATREILKKHGMTMPPMVNAQGANQYEQIPTPYERGMGQYAQAKASSATAQDPVQKAKAVSELIGNRPWSGDEGDAYDPKNPEHRIWMQSLEELGGGPSPAGESPAGSLPESAPAEKNKSFMQMVQDTLPVRGAPAAGSAPAAETPMVLGGLSENLGNLADQANQPRAPTGASRTPGSWARGVGVSGGMAPAGGVRPPRSGPYANAGSAMAAIPGPELLDEALGQYEQAGGATVRNAQKIQQSQAASATGLKAAGRAIKAYKASPEYVEMTRTTGRLLNETDLSGPTKEILAGQSAADQKRLLQRIHKYGEAKVLASLQGSTRPKGNF
jgi:hypothetical protein